MPSKAEKKANRRRSCGRPRDEEASREPNGRISRAKEPADMVALKARAMQAGITLAEAKDQKAATFIGILSIRGIGNGGITLAQYDALVEYQKIRADMQRAIAAPGSGTNGEGPGGGGSEISQQYVTWCSTARQRYDEAKRAIGLEQEGNRTDNLWGALDLCVHQDQRMWHLVGSLRLVANCLARHLRGLDRQARARN